MGGRCGRGRRLAPAREGFSFHSRCLSQIVHHSWKGRGLERRLWVLCAMPSAAEHAGLALCPPHTPALAPVCQTALSPLPLPLFPSPPPRPRLAVESLRQLALKSVDYAFASEGEKLLLRQAISSAEL